MLCYILLWDFLSKFVSTFFAVFFLIKKCNIAGNNRCILALTALFTVKTQKQSVPSLYKKSCLHLIKLMFLNFKVKFDKIIV